jgi:hypothetical protein
MLKKNLHWILFGAAAVAVIPAAAHIIRLFSAVELGPGEEASLIPTVTAPMVGSLIVSGLFAAAAVAVARRSPS